MGWASFLFQQPINEELICVICKGVLNRPEVLICSHYFCASCINNDTIRRSQLTSCPQCHTPVTLNDSLSVKAPAWLLLQLDVLMITCPQRCGQQMMLKTLETHLLNDCSETNISCPNKNVGCMVRISRKKMAKHLNQCFYRRVQCSACKEELTYNNLAKHQTQKRCDDKAINISRVHCIRRCNFDIKTHNKSLRDDALRTAQEERRITLMHWATRGIRGFEKYDPNKAVTVLEKEELEVKLNENENVAWCIRCKKSFLMNKNHSNACKWHAGPVIETFGGFCLACGKLTNEKGCQKSHHLDINK